MKLRKHPRRNYSLLGSLLICIKNGLFIFFRHLISRIISNIYKTKIHVSITIKVTHDITMQKDISIFSDICSTYNTSVPQFVKSLSISLLLFAMGTKSPIVRKSKIGWYTAINFYDIYKT